MSQHERDIANKASAVLNQYWDGLLPVDPVKIATMMGVKVYGRGKDGDNFPMSGRFRMWEGSPTIEFNAAEGNIRQRFVVAHELAHYVLGHHDTPADSGNFYESDSQIERDATAMARELLMPYGLVLHNYNLGVFSKTEQFAELFGVSTDAFGHRLINMGLV